MTEMTTTERKFAVTTLVLTGFVGQVIVRIAIPATSKTASFFKTAFGMRTLTKKQQSKTTENENTRRN
jgi:small neutral amino acid transporter SnatA (MarC family)